MISHNIVITDLRLEHCPGSRDFAVFSLLNKVSDEFKPTIQSTIVSTVRRLSL